MGIDVIPEGKENIGLIDAKLKLFLVVQKIPTDYTMTQENGFSFDWKPTEFLKYFWHEF